ncbi:MAG: dihydroorotase [Lachnospiraceae bacterium]|nr:dihydroorotase [Lachnospiraceae bacterium]
MKLLIKNGRVLDPSVNLDKVCDVLVEDGVVADIADAGSVVAYDEVIDAEGCFVMPGLIDLHVHLREPGFEHKETIETGSKAAAAGGFTTICPMPNTKPSTDSPEMVEWVINKAAEVSPINIVPVGAVTLGQAGDETTDIVGMKAKGALAISEDGKSVMNAKIYREAMDIAAKNDVLIMAHCEDKNLVGKGALNAGVVADRLGIQGITNSVEDVIVARDIVLAAETGAKLHLCHCSTAGSVVLLRDAKAEGIAVTGEVCPHHFAMTEDEITSDDANFKMNPPLRSAKDVQALKEALRDDIMDVISTDHAPHHADEKAKGIAEAPFGIVGSETAVALTVTHLLETGYLTPLQMAAKMSTNPAKILGIDKGTLQPGKIADITIINPTEEYVIDKNTFVSKGKNTPFHGKTVRGKVKYTIVSGKVVFAD